MVAKLRQKADLNLLRNEASKVMDDLSNLGKVLAEVGEETSQDVKEDVKAVLERQISSLKDRITELNHKVAENARVVDRHVRANPYLYIISSMGVGFLMAKLIPSRSQSSERSVMTD